MRSIYKCLSIEQSECDCSTFVCVHYFTVRYLAPRREVKALVALALGAAGYKKKCHMQFLWLGSPVGAFLGLWSGCVCRQVQLEEHGADESPIALH
jgi:hypothetical protein